MSDKNEPSAIGKRFQELRKENGWTLDYVAKCTGISKSTLSKLENGKTSLTFTSVSKLADGLGLPIATLTTPHGKQVMARRSYTRLGGGDQFETDDGRYEILCDGLADKSQAFMRIIITSHSPEEPKKWHHHPGLEFIYVLKGALELHTEAYDPLILKTGDSIVFDAEMGHKYVSTGKQDAELLISFQSSGYRGIEEAVEQAVRS